MKRLPSKSNRKRERGERGRELRRARERGEREWEEAGELRGEREREGERFFYILISNSESLP